MDEIIVAFIQLLCEIFVEWLCCWTEFRFFKRRKEKKDD